MNPSLFIAVIGGLGDQTDGPMQGMKALSEELAARWPEATVQCFRWDSTAVAQAALDSGADIVAMAGYSMGVDSGLRAAKDLPKVDFLASIDAVPWGAGQLGVHLMVPGNVKVCKAWRRRTIAILDGQPIAQFPEPQDFTTTDYEAIPVAHESHWQLPHDPSIHAAIADGIEELLTS